MKAKTMSRVLIGALLALSAGCGNDATQACARWCESISQCPGRPGYDGCYVTVCDRISDDDPCFDELADYYDCLHGLALECSTDLRSLEACEDLIETCD